MTPCVQGICMARVNGITGNLWQQHITAVTALPPDTAVTPDPYVERLFEGFAFSMGRLREKIDDDLPD